MKIFNIFKITSVKDDLQILKNYLLTFNHDTIENEKNVNQKIIYLEKEIEILKDYIRSTNYKIHRKIKKIK